MRPRLTLLALALLFGAFDAVPALAAAPIEQVWSFNGGQVAIHAALDGTLVGTVIQPTRFAQCSHPIGEEMWTGMHQQPDGSYSGQHQWFFETSECVRNPRLGPSAWRVMEASGGTHYLLACFSAPGGPQPTIALNGARTNVTYGCRESARVAPIPVQPSDHSRAGHAGFAQSVTLPSNRKCFSRRSFQIHLKDPTYDPLKEVLVMIAGRRVRVRRHGRLFAATIDLRGLPRGTFTVRIRLTTVLGRHLSGSRTYHTCVPKRTRRKAHPRKASAA